MRDDDSLAAAGFLILLGLAAALTGVAGWLASLGATWWVCALVVGGVLLALGFVAANR